MKLMNEENLLETALSDSNERLKNDRGKIAETYKKILKEGSSLNERLTSIYTTSLTKFGGLESFKPVPMPITPLGWDQAIFEYKNTNYRTDLDRSKAWQGIRDEYFVYLNKLESWKTENESNLNYLKTVLKHFEENDVYFMREEIQDVIKSFTKP